MVEVTLVKTLAENSVRLSSMGKKRKKGFAKHISEPLSSQFCFYTPSTTNYDVFTIERT